jgi:hypothetical protein
MYSMSSVHYHFKLIVHVIQLNRFDNQLEFSVVRTMAKAVHYGMYPDSALEAIYSGMARCFTNKPVDPSRLDLIDIRSWLFTLYDWVANWTIDACTPEELEHSIAWIHRIISEDLFAILSLHNTNQGKIVLATHC